MGGHMKSMAGYEIDRGGGYEMDVGGPMKWMGGNYEIDRRHMKLLGGLRN